MSDVGLFLTEPAPGKFELDIKVGDYDLLADDGAETATFISLFSNQWVDVDEIPYLTTARFGWWGDTLASIVGDQIGSKLWTLDREKTTSQTLQRFIDYTKDALQWMLDDGFTDKIDVDAVYIRTGVIELMIDIYRPDIKEGLFRIVWDGQEIKRA